MNMETLEKGQNIEVYTTGGAQFHGKYAGLYDSEDGLLALMLNGKFITRFIFVQHITGVGIRNEDTPRQPK